MIRARCLRAGDTIGVAAPSSPVEADKLKTGVALIEARGYRVVVGEHVLATMAGNSYLAGTDVQRAADLNELFARPDIAAIFCARGGYGAARLWELLDWQTIDANPKIFVGYSDITSLHLALARTANLVTFHGKMVTTLADLDETSLRVFWRILEDPTPFGTLPADPAAMQTLVPGTVEGDLTGGCLTLLANACGSPYPPDFRGKIVLIEDVGEAVYRADRYLFQLRNAGILREAAGFVVGTLTRWQKEEAEPPKNTPEALWQDLLVPLGKPTLVGFPFGHEPNPLTLPLGVRARLDANERALTLLESATQA